MGQRSQHLRLALEAGEPLGVAGKHVGQDLQRHVALQARVARAIHLTMPPAPSKAVTS